MYYDGEIRIETDDQCYTCEYFLKGVQCPLLEALAVGVVNLEGDVVVKNCGFYREFKRHLRVIEPVEPSSEQSPAAGESSLDDSGDEGSRKPGSRKHV